MKLRVQELRWQSGNQLFQVQRYDEDNDFWYPMESDGPYNVLEDAIAAAKLMLNPPPRPPIQEIIHQIPL